MNDVSLHVEQWAGYNEQEKEKAKMALVLWELTFNKSHFFERLLSHSRTDGSPGFSDTSLANFEVLKKLFSDSELNNSTGYSVHIKLFMMNGADSNPNAIGYFDANKIWTYRDRFHQDTMTLSKLAGHYAHEWCHSIGFNHPQNLIDSVPYALGSIVEELTKEFI